MPRLRHYDDTNNVTAITDQQNFIFLWEKKMMDKKQEYNYRQIKLMTYKINEFKRKLISLDELISNLRGLLDCLRDINDDWSINFVSYWADLESVNANALDLNKSDFDTHDYNIITKALNGIENLIAIYIKEFFLEHEYFENKDDEIQRKN
jgi:hypothetical protein